MKTMLIAAGLMSAVLTPCADAQMIPCSQRAPLAWSLSFPRTSLSGWLHSLPAYRIWGTQNMTVQHEGSTNVLEVDISERLHRSRGDSRAGRWGRVHLSVRRPVFIRMPGVRCRVRTWLRFRQGRQVAGVVWRRRAFRRCRHEQRFLYPLHVADRRGRGGICLSAGKERPIR